MKEVPASKKQAEDARRERDFLDKQLSVVDTQLAKANKQLAAANGQLANVTEQLVAVTGQMTASVGSEAKLRKHADDMVKQYEKKIVEQSEECKKRLAERIEQCETLLAERSKQCEKRLAEQNEQFVIRMEEQSKKHSDAIRQLMAEGDERHANEIRRLTTKHDERHARELRQLTDELDATKSSGALKVEELRVALLEQSTRAQVDKSTAADQRASIARLTSLLQNKHDFERTLCLSKADTDESPAASSMADESPTAGQLFDGASTGDDCHAPSQTQVVVAQVPRSLSSTDSSVTYDIVRFTSSNVVPPTTVQCGCCVADGTSDSTDCAANDDHCKAVAGRDSACVKEYGRGDVTNSQAAMDCGSSPSVEQLRPNPGVMDNSSVACDEAFVMKLIEKYKYAMETDAELSSTTDG